MKERYAELKQASADRCPRSAGDDCEGCGSAVPSRDYNQLLLEQVLDSKTAMLERVRDCGAFSFETSTAVISMIAPSGRLSAAGVRFVAMPLPRVVAFECCLFRVISGVTHYMQTSYNGIPVPSNGKPIEYANGKVQRSRSADHSIHRRRRHWAVTSGRLRSACSMRQSRRPTAASASGVVRSAGRGEGVSPDTELAARRYRKGNRGLPRVDQRTADDAGGRRNPQLECCAAAVDGSVLSAFGR